MKIILKKEVANLGDSGDVVEVKTGYALNYLVPQGFATVATASALKQHEETLRQRAHKEAKIVADAEAAAAAISAIEVKLTAKVGESGKLYGAVTAAQVAETLAQKGAQVEKKNITLPEIKEPGEYEARIKCYKGVFATVKVLVEAE
ncbi:MAG: 50S ribosomal protein L9 [Bacteroidales bacterium]|nr:50S ribosomal protein L9 [Bacteroidales bacterium]